MVNCYKGGRSPTHLDAFGGGGLVTLLIQFPGLFQKKLFHIQLYIHLYPGEGVNL